MAQSRRSLIVTTYDLSSGSTGATSKPFSTSNGVTLSSSSSRPYATEVRATLLWWGILACTKIILCGVVYTGYRDREAPRKPFKDCLKNSLSASHIDHCRRFILTGNCDDRHLTTKHIISSFDNILNHPVQ